MPETRELELKLEVLPRQGKALKKGLSQLGEPAARQRLVSTYFDTDGYHLRENGLTLRIRSDGSGRVQTVKQSRGAPGIGVFDRSEWESEISGDEPDIAAAAGSPLDDLDKGVTDRLRPVFRSDVERTTWRVERDGATIEVALDDGRMVLGDESHPFGELELELKDGLPAALFALARTLDGTGALRLGVLAKSERGYRLAAGESVRHYKAEPVGLTRGTTTADAFAAITRACIRHFRLNEAAVTEKRAAEGLHQARVAIRRLRSALSIFKALLGDPESEAIKSRLRAFAALLGEGRNLDVYLERLRSPEPDDPPAAPELTVKLSADREVAYDGIAKALASKRFRGLMLDLLVWAEDGAWREAGDPEARERLARPIEETASDMLKARRRRVRKRGRHLAAISPEARHEVRIEAKKLRYAAEFFTGLVERKRDRKRLKAFLSGLEELQESLGQLNDLETARVLRAEHGTPEAEKAMRTGDDEGQERELIATAAAAYDVFSDAKPFWRDFA